MNLVLVTNILTPYRKVFYDELAKQCKENGDSFRVLVMARTEPGRHWTYEEYETSYTELLSGKLVQIGNIYTIINYDLEKKLAKWNPDIVIASGSYMITTVWQIIRLSSKYGYKMFFWSESHDEEERNYNKIKLYLRESFRKTVLGKFDGYWYPGVKAKALLEKYGKCNATYVQVPNLVNGNTFKVKFSENEKKKIFDKYQLDSGKKIFLCPARLHPVKGILEFMKLLRKCSNSHKVTILIAGDGELRAEIEKYSKQFSLDVRLLGYQTEEQMVKLYSIADVFLLPSKSDPNPLSCIEACWQKKPLLVSTHVGNHPEIVQEGKNGFVFSYLNERESISKIESLIEATSEWIDNAGEHSYKVAQNYFMPDIQVKRILEEMRNYMSLK